MKQTASSLGTTRNRRLPRSVRRRQLLAAAQEIFVDRGYHAAAMDDIADRAGISKPVLYQHFPSKRDLYLALLKEHTDALVDQVRAAMAATADNETRVHNAISTYFDFVDGDGEAFRLVFESDLRNDQAVRERMEEGVRRCMSAIADAIVADTGLPQSHAELLSVALTGLSEVAARYWLSRQTTDDPAITKSEAVALLEALAWRGLSGFPRHV